MKSALSLATLASLASAFPGLKPEERQLSGLLGGQLGNIVNDVSGVVGSVAAAVDPDNLRPEPGFDFHPPGPNDSRGPCPGLNTLANHGYLPRDGHVNVGQVLEATSRGFNMGTDLALVLCIFAVLTDGDIETESWYLGANPDHTGGLNRHSTVEVDASPNREDTYLGCGDNHHLSSRMFTQNVQYVAADANKEFSYDVMRKQYSANSRFSQQYNPWFYYFPFPSIVSVVAYNFYPEFFSNGTYGLGGVANYDSISSIVGAKFNKKTGQFQYVPEQFPKNWYRRATPYEAVQALTDGFTRIYPANPVAMPIAQLGTPNLNASTILCDLYQGLNSITPLELSGDAQTAEAGVTWALAKLLPVLGGTTLGCPPSTISANPLYGNATTKGGPLGPSVGQVKNAGNNKYNKSYFCKAPTTPTCNTAC